MGHTQSTVGLLLAVVGCGGAKDAETRAPDTETTDTETTDTETTDTETGCAVQVDLSGGIEPGCGAIDAPCGTITAGLMEAVAGCRVEVGAGTYSGATGETFPLVVGTGIEISGAGRSETVIDDAAGTGTQTFPTCDRDLIPVVATSGTGVQIQGLTVAARTNLNTAVGVFVVDGDLALSDVLITGGQDGVFVASGTADLTDLEVTDAGHAAIKPAGTAVVTVANADIHHNKDAIEPICESTVTVTDSEIYCNGNGVEALGSATTTAINNHIYNNNLGLAARGGATTITARGNTIELNKFGVLEIFGIIDLGTTGDPGGNTLQNNAFAGMVAVNVPTDLYAIGNTWVPNVDRADASGLYSGTVSFGARIENCPVTALGDIDTAWDPMCASGFPQELGFKNVAVDDGSCDGGQANPVGIVIVSE